MTKLASLATFAIAAASFAHAAATPPTTGSNGVVARQVLVSHQSYSLRDVQKAAKAKARREAKAAVPPMSKRSRKGRRACTTPTPTPEPAPEPTPEPQVRSCFVSQHVI